MLIIGKLERYCLIEVKYDAGREESIKELLILSSLISLLKNGPTTNIESSNNKVMMQVPNRSREE